MTDNSDLLAGIPAPVAAPKKRGRPPKAPKTATPAEITAAGEAQSATPAIVVPPEVLEAPLLVPASTSETVQNAAEAEAGHPLPDLSDLLIGVDPAGGPDSTVVSVANPDGSVSVQLPPISVEYAAALANRPVIIGQTTRDYAYKRLLRAGKKL